MRNTGILIDERFSEHQTGPMHPERPERLQALLQLLSTEAYRGLPRIGARSAEQAELAWVHSSEHVHTVAASAGKPLTHFDGDTPASARSFEAALLAAGGTLELVDAIMDGSLANGLAAVRPPGHHAERSHPMGFCLFNNVAIAAEHLRRRHGLQRVLVLDWDVHHGNGTQHRFEDDPAVLYASLHQHPFYPGTGAATDLGRGEGEGYTLNVPMPAGADDDDYMAAFRELVLPVVGEFAPQFVLVSAGFDAHRSDPLASVELTTEAFGRMADALTEVADESADGRIAMVLEGGYDLTALTDSVALVLDRLRSPRPFEAAGGSLNVWGLSAAQAQKAYWSKL